MGRVYASNVNETINTLNTMNTIKFQADINLDDPEEVETFIAEHGRCKGRTLANALGFKGTGATKAANALSNYAYNKQTAMDCRLKGDITDALRYEAICDRIYKEDIQNTVECW